MRRLVPVVLALAVTSCSSSTHRSPVASGSPLLTPTASPTAAPTATASASPSPTASSTPSPAGVVPTPAGGPVPRGFAPMSVTFIDRSTGWALGGRTIARTTDGGRSWRALPAPAADLTGLRFADRRHGFAYGATLHATQDGGATWATVGVPGRVVDLAVAAGRVWVASSAVGRVRLLTGGLSGPLTQVASATAPDQPGDLQVVAQGGTGYLVTGPAGPAARPRLVALTGSTASDRTLPCASGESPALAASASRLALVCAGDVGAGQQAKTAWTSSNGGRTWSRLAPPPQVAGTTVAVTAEATYVGNSRTGVDVTRDGRSWSTSLDAPDGVGWVGMLDGSFGEALVGLPPAAVLELTRDGGRHWERVRF